MGALPLIPVSWHMRATRDQIASVDRGLQGRIPKAVPLKGRRNIVSIPASCEPIQSSGAP